MEEYQTDILIIGGGVAGSAMAASLKNSPFHITLIDSRPTFEDLNRGDILWPASLEICQKWNVFETVKAYGIPFHTFSFHAKEKTIASYNFSQTNKSIPYALSIEHTNIETALLQAASSDNLQIIKGMAATELIETEERNQGVIFTGLGKKIFMKARLIIGADGGYSFLRTAMHIKVNPKQYASDAIIFWMPIEKTISSGVSVHLDLPYITLLQILPENKLRVAINVPKGNARSWFEKTRKEKYEKLRFISPIFQVVKPYFYKEHIYSLRTSHAPNYWYKNAVLIGDAAHECHPISTQGIGNAIEDAYILSSILNNSLELLPAKLKKYEHTRRDPVRKILHHSHLLAKSMSSREGIQSKLINCLLPSMQNSPFITKILFHKVFLFGNHV